MKKILIPTDFSPCARAAEENAFNIALLAKAELQFLHIVSTPLDWINLPLEDEKLYKETKAKIGFARTELEKLKLRAKKLKLTASYFITFDKGPNEIIMHVKNYGNDFIIMGSHGEKGIKKIIGSNTRKVVRNSPIPVLTVKPSDRKICIESIVFATLFNETAKKAFVETLEFSNYFESTIHLLYVNTPDFFEETDKIEKMMRSFLADYNLTNCSSHIYNSLDEQRGIDKFSSKVKADLIAVASNARNSLLQLFSPSVTENLVNHSEIPVLCFKCVEKSEPVPVSSEVPF